MLQTLEQTRSELVTNEVVEEIDDSFNVECVPLSRLEDCTIYITNSKWDLKLLTYNVRSLNKNFDHFLIMLHQLDTTFDVIVLTECWLGHSNNIQQIDGYTCSFTNLNINKAGGVVVYVRDSLHSITEEIDFKGEANCMLVDIIGVTTIMGIYRSPFIKNTDKFVEILDQTLITQKNKKNFIVVGDLNIDIMNTKDASSAQISNYLSLLSEHGFFPAITKPTHLKSCIDHIFFRPYNNAVGVVGPSSSTDHSVVMLGLTLQRAKVQVPDRTFNKLNYQTATKELKTLDWSFVTNDTDPSTAANALISTIQSVITKHTHTVKISRSKHNLKPWITPGMIRCIKNRDKLHSNLRKDPENLIKKLTYTRYRNFCNDLLRKLKNKYNAEELQKHRNDPKKLWKSINNICHTTKKKTLPTELLSFSKSPKESLSSCNKYFSTLGENMANDTLIRLNTTQECLAQKTRVGTSPGVSFFLAPTDAPEVDVLIRGLRSDSAPGIDGITATFLKLNRDTLIAPLTHVFNLSLSNGTFPDCWKKAAVTPIYKSGPKNTPSNYRPISLLSIVSKLLEKIVQKRLCKFLDYHKLLASRQFGFQQGRSTEDAVNLLSSLVTNYLDTNQSCVGVFLDLARAFDTVSITILLSKLEKIGIRGVALAWFRSYLTKREQCLRVGNSLSDTQSVCFGVPQGSVLGPTLFNIYINDLLSLTLQNAEIICYADDTAILFHGTTWPVTFQYLEQGLADVVRWLENNLLNLNISKTKFITFHKTSSSQPESVPSVRVHRSNCKLNYSQPQCDCDFIEQVEVMKYLGVLIDHKLNFHQHIAVLSRRVRKIIHVMLLLREAACLSVLRMVYLGLCQSVITYCISTWGGTDKTCMLQIERAQRAVIKVMLNRPRRYPTNLVYAESHVLSVRQLFILKAVLCTHWTVVRSKTKYEKLLKKRVFKIDIPKTLTSFAKRHKEYLFPFIYNKSIRKCDIKTLHPNVAKSKVVDWLLTLNYAETESLLSSVN